MARGNPKSYTPVAGWRVGWKQDAKGRRYLEGTLSIGKHRIARVRRTDTGKNNVSTEFFYAMEEVNQKLLKTIAENYK